jgi:hypothetical protein
MWRFRLTVVADKLRFIRNASGFASHGFWADVAAWRIFSGVVDGVKDDYRVSTPS